MDRDSFIIAVFLLVCEQYGVIRQQCRLRRGGFEPALTDEEVITIEICGEYFKLECDKDIFAYFHTHYLHFFRNLLTGLCLSAKLQTYGRSKRPFSNA